MGDNETIVVNSDGSIGRYALGVNKKTSLLNKEGVFIRKGKVADYEKKIFSFT